MITRILKIRKEEALLSGEHETNVSDGSEGELHTYKAVCEKNPGHINFIPVDKFTLEHLPEGQRDNDLYTFIKDTADLTVRVNVYKTSPNRPKFWPKTKKPYPFYNTRELDDMRTGTGMMCLVNKHKDGVGQYADKHLKTSRKCWCGECEHSGSPNNVWWEFYVLTATHVIFGDFEANHTILRLFYDCKDSPVIKVDKAHVIRSDIKHDSCWLRCVTCDNSLGDKLEKIWKHYLDVWKKVREKFPNFKSANNLTFIVSHPHGCTKQVSIGHWIKEYNEGKDNRSFTYTTCTCPGSSGAKVNCVGDSVWGWVFYGLIHSGTNFKHKYNYSGVGL